MKFINQLNLTAMRKMFYLFVLGFSLFCINTTNAQSDKFKALFMYNFTKNIQWPSGMQQGDFVIGVLGSSGITKELQTIAKTKKTGNQTIVVREFASVDAVANVHILYLPTNKSSDMKNILSKVNGKSVLLITDKNGLALQGSCINYVMDGDKILFEISKNNIEKQGLKVSTALINLGIAIQ